MPLGHVISLQARPLGTTLAAAGSVGDGVLTVDDVAKVNWPDGALRIGSEQFFYTVDAAPDQSVATIDQDEEPEGWDEEGTITLSGLLKNAYDVDEPVIQFPVVTERVATVILPDQAEELVLRVPRGLWDRLSTDIRQRDFAPEAVQVENIGGEWVMTDVISEDPSIDGSFLNISTLPATEIEAPSTASDLATFFDEVWTAPGAAVGIANSVYAHAVGAGIADPPVPASTGFVYTQVPYNDTTIGTVEWLDTIKASGPPDGNYAVASNQTGADHNSRYLGAVFFASGLSVPVGATIDGITVTYIRRKVPPKTVTDNSVRLLKAGVPTGADYAKTDLHWPNDFTGVQYGGANDLWGTTWTPADINDPNFGVALSAVVPSLGVAEVDAIRVKVNYTIPAVTARSNTHWLYARNCGFVDIPDDATITGVTVAINRHASDDLGNDYATDNSVLLTNGTDYSSNQATKAHWPTSDAYASYGGDLWGMELTPADVKASSFGVVISANVQNGVTAYIDNVKITVAYVTAGDAG